MKKTKLIAALIICFAIASAFCGCTQDSGEVTTEPTATEEFKTEKFSEPKPLEEVGLTYNDLVSANSVEGLLKKHDVITVDSNYGDTQLFSYKSQPVYLEHAVYSDDEEFISGWVDGITYTLSGEQYFASVNAFALHEKSFPYDSFIVDYFSGMELFVEEIGEDYYRIINVYEDMLENERYEFIFDKETLELREHNYTLFDDTSGSVKVDFDKPLNKFSSDIAKTMDGERKNITVKSELYDGDEVIRNEAVFSLPHDWETEMLAGVEIALYSNAEQTEIYEYPGHGIDHTIYVTNSLG